MIRRGWMRMTSGLMYGLGGSWPVRASAVPRTSKQRGVHGLTEARSSTTNATLPLAAMLWNLRVLPRSRPRMSITSASASIWNPTGLFCSVPSGASVARRPRRWDRRYSSSASVNITSAKLTRPPSTPRRTASTSGAPPSTPGAPPSTPWRTAKHPWRTAKHPWRTAKHPWRTAKHPPAPPSTSGGPPSRNDLPRSAPWPPQGGERRASLHRGSAAQAGAAERSDQLAGSPPPVTEGDRDRPRRRVLAIAKPRVDRVFPGRGRPGEPANRVTEVRGPADRQDRYQRSDRGDGPGARPPPARVGVGRHDQRRIEQQDRQRGIPGAAFHDDRDPLARPAPGERRGDRREHEAGCHRSNHEHPATPGLRGNRIGENSEYEAARERGGPGQPQDVAQVPGKVPAKRRQKDVMRVVQHCVSRIMRSEPGLVACQDDPDLQQGAESPAGGRGVLAEAPGHHDRTSGEQRREQEGERA